MCGFQSDCCLLVLVIAVFHGCSSQTFQADPCDHKVYKNISDPFRSTGFLTAPPVAPLCDMRLRRGWYRFTSRAGGEMPTSCQETNRCGTTNPIWLDGVNPTQDEGIAMRQICVNLNSTESNQARYCCGYSEDIFVKNCGDYMVYYLQSTMDCPMAYCAGSVPPCPVGKWSKTNFPPCKDPFPVFESAPKIVGPQKLDNGSYVFVCDITVKESDPDQRFEVSWTFNGGLDPYISLQTLSENETTAYLDIGRLNNHIDQHVGCQVRSYYIGREANKSPLISSNTTYFGIKKAPVLTGPHLADNQSFSFQCQLSCDADDNDSVVAVVWTFNGQTDSSLSPQLLTCSNMTASLDGSLLNGHLNKRIGCQSRLVYPGSNVTTRFVSSNTQFAGIQITPGILEISEIDFEKFVTVTSTVPIVCGQNSQCCLTFRLNANETTAVSFVNSCEHKLCASHWDPITQSASIQIGVVPTRNILVAGTRGMSLSFEPLRTLGSNPYLNIFHGSKPGTLQVVVKDESAFKCSLTGDPHIYGFDFKIMYNLYKSGDFIAYVAPARDFMVQVRTVPCGSGYVTCICGIVVRERNDVIKISKCPNPYSVQPTVEIAYKLSSGTVVQRSADGYRIGVYLPSGSEVKIESGGTNVYISVPAFDKGKGRGLCGTNDGNQTNDFTYPDGRVDPPCVQSCEPNAFLESWRVSGNTSLFEAVPDPVNTTDNVSGSGVQFCSCLENADGNLTVTCSERQHIQAANTACLNCPIISDRLTPSYEPGVGWIKLGTNKPEKPFVHPPVTTGDSNKQWPNNQGVTEAQARSLCTQALQKSQLYLNCQRFDQIRNSVLDDCLADILHGGSTDFLDDSTSSFTTKCQLKLAEDPDSYTTDRDQQVLKPEILDICPIECSRHGKCGERGHCTCQDGWEGETCLIESGKGPQIVGILGGDVCDVVVNTCHNLSLTVSNVNFLSILQYRVQATDELGNKIGSPVISTATFLSPEVVTCSLPLHETSTQKYKISATKDGTLFGNEVTFRIFDGICLNCDLKQCTVKNTACHINNTCYKNGEVDKINGNRTCDVTKSTTRWTVIRTNNDTFPVLETPPVLTRPHFQLNGSAYFQCEIIYGGTDPDQVFEVVWTFNGRSDPSIPAQFLFGTERFSILNISSLRNLVDTNVSCQVRSFYSGFETDKSTFQTSNTSLFLGIQRPPVLVGPVVTSHNTTTFNCQLATALDSSQQVEMSWLFNNQPDPLLPAVSVPGDNHSVELEGDMVARHLGSQISCQARLVFPGTDIKTSFVRSNGYFAGIQIWPNPLVIRETELERNITITSTVPILCPVDDDSGGCCLTLRINVKPLPALSLIYPCQYQLCSSDWDPHKKLASTQVTVVPKRNILAESSRNIQLTLVLSAPSNSSSYLLAFQKYKPDFQITVRDMAASRCSITGDPHIMGFDFPFMYDLYTSGDYVALTAPDKDVMIQIRTVPCGSVACNCGVVIREKNDVVRISNCNNPRNGLTLVDIAYELRGGTIVRRSTDGQRFGVYLPSGTEVKIEAGYYINIYISVPAHDRGLGRGLCGTNDGITDNDFTHPNGEVDRPCTQRCIPSSFLESWRVSGNDSLFEVVPDPVNSSNSSFVSPALFCSCLEKADGNLTDQCSEREYVVSSNTACTNCPTINDRLTPSYWPGIGWIKPGTKDPEPPFVHPSVIPPNINTQWPNIQGITEDQAKNLCTDALQKSQLYSQCESFNHLTTSSLSDCLADILIGGTTDFLGDITASFTTQCQLTLAQNPDNYDNNTEGQQTIKPEFLEHICPNECYQHGTCGERGRCVCQDGWEGDTCLIASGLGPQLLQIRGGSLCDITKDRCDRVIIDVTNINFLNPLWCRVQLVDVSGQNMGTANLTAATFLSPDLIACLLPGTNRSSQRFNISASSNGTVFGNELVFRTFDSTCLDCKFNECLEKTTACHINNTCYKNGDHNVFNVNQTCDITKSTTRWTIRRSDQDRYPSLTGPPLLTGPCSQEDGSVIFQCEVLSDSDDPEQMFEVSWTFNGQFSAAVPYQILKGDERVADLNVTLLKNLVDRNVGCRVRSFYAQEETKSPFVSSNTTFFGIERQPVLRGPVILQNTSFVFECLITYDERLLALIEVAWTFDGQLDDSLPSQIINETDQPVFLDGLLLKGHLNSKVGCQARLVYYESHVTTTYVRSNTYFVGIQFSPNPLQISEVDFQREVRVVSTIPILCDSSGDCCITFRVNLSDTSAVSLVDSCSYDLCYQDWDSAWSNASRTISVVPKRNLMLATVKQAYLSLVLVVPVQHLGSYLQVFHSYQPGQLPIQVIDKTAFTCSMTGDPHMRGFDLKMTYHMYLYGDFIAYTAPYRDFMVQVRTRPCADVSCVCGIVVREYNNVIKVSKCNSSLPTVDIAYNLSAGAVVQRSSDGYRFGIYLASGSVVRIESGGTNVYVTVPAFDKGRGRGMCGTSDGVEDNDFTHRDGTVDPVCQGRCIPDSFIRSWRVSGNESLFEVVPDLVSTSDTSYGSSSQYCLCQDKPDGNQTVVCTTRPYTTRRTTVCSNCQDITDLLTPSYVAHVGWVRPGSNKPEPPFIPPPDSATNNKQWPSQQGITEVQARNMCSQAMRDSQLFAHCENQQQLTSSIMEDCLGDILYGGSTAFTQEITSSFTSQCQIILSRDPTNYVNTSDGEQVLKPELVEICPQECFRHGSCGQGGRCLCQAGWTGETCMLESGKGPQLLEIIGGFICDLTERACHTIHIDVGNINSGDTLYCRLQEVNDQGKSLGSPIVAVAVFVSPNTITCNLPVHDTSRKSYNVSAGRDRELFGNELTFQIYDGKCLDCDSTGCKEKTTACHINGTCFSHQEVDQADNNRICDVTRSITSWTLIREPTTQTTLGLTTQTTAGPTTQTTAQPTNPATAAPEIVYPTRPPRDQTIRPCQFCFGG